MIAEWLAIAIVTMYALAITCLAVYGVNFFYLAVIAPHVRGLVAERSLPNPPPLVTVQLPVFNERLVAKRVIDATACLDWPRDRLEIQVLDDSTDATSDIVARVAASWRSVGVDIQHIQRPHREGYKAGALSAGLAQAKGEFVAIFDADFVPFPDFLHRTIGMFDDPQVGFVQARWEHLNRHTSLFTRLQSLSIDGHFMVEQLVRASKGYVMHFNGTAGVWRRAAIEDAGGWNPNSLTEDLDLSYRAVLRGWKPVYLPDVAVPCELVPRISAYRKQQARWAQGSAECACRLLPTVIRSHLRMSAKIQAILHLTGYSIQVLMLISSLLYPLIVLVTRIERWHMLLSWLGTILIPATMAPTFLLLTAQQLLRPGSWWRRVPTVLALIPLGAGMILNNSRAVWRGLRARPMAFERTPKWGLVAGHLHPRASPYRLPGDWSIISEFVLAGLNAGTAALAWRFQNYGIFIYAMLLAIGLAIVSVWTAWEICTCRDG